MPVIIVAPEKAEQFIQGSISNVVRRCSKIPVKNGDNLTFIEKLQPTGQRTVMTAKISSVKPIIITDRKEVRICGVQVDWQDVDDVARHTGFESTKAFLESFGELPWYGELIGWSR